MGHSCRVVSQHLRSHRGPSFQGSASPSPAICAGGTVSRKCPTVSQLATKIDQIMTSSAEIAAKAPFAPVKITDGILADEAMQLFAK